MNDRESLLIENGSPRAASQNLSAHGELPSDILEQVLARLELRRRPEPTLEGLSEIYGAWCQHVPFDNVRKIIHMRSGNPGPLPGSSPEDFFAAWLKHGTGGTCWSGAGSLYALLQALGFDSARGIATMLVTPDLPPNHGTVIVNFNEERYLVDSSILHGIPLQLQLHSQTAVEHPAWGVRCGHREGRWHLAWRPLHKTDGFECRLERIGAAHSEFEGNYEKTRLWSPFNYQLSARSNRGNRVVGVGLGQSVVLHEDGSVSQSPLSSPERARLLVEEIGLSEEIVAQLPDDVQTPPPPWSTTAARMSQELQPQST